MKKHNINITKATTIEAHGNHTNGNSKATVCLETGTVYTSMTDTAIALECTIDAVSNTIRGKQKTCKGYHLCLLSEIDQHLPMMLEQNNTSHPKAKANVKKTKAEVDRKELAEIRAKAKAYDKLMAEEEAKRKAEEKAQKRKAKHEAEKTKLQAYIQKRTTIREKAKATMDAEDRKIMKAEQKLEALMDKEVL